jgi:peptidoglycan/LPS O-acetylase OafA/YrhL
MHDRRDDVQGLRAVAVVLVVAYHLWPQQVPGGYVGVDAFFVISGFLITRNLLAAPPSGRGDVVAFWGRRIRRLLPAAFLVLGVTLFGSRFLAPDTDWIRTAHEAIASAFYVENWLLVRQAADYLSPDVSPTPVQHYWSLAVEEQFYLVWPLLLLGVVLLAGRRVAVRTTARVGIALVLVASLAYCVHRTAADPAGSYFLTTTRIWELAAGGLLATWIPPVRLPVGRAVGAWAGMALILAAALAFDTSTPWPGSAALLPVAGAALFIWSASGARLSPGLVLGTRPVQWLGDASYSVYLWHWPLLVLAPLALDRELTLTDELVILGLTLVLSWLTYEHVENRWRLPHPATPTRRPFQMAAVGAVCVMTIAAAQIVGVHLTERTIAARTGDVQTLRCYGAAALAAGTRACPSSEVGDLTPPPTAAMKDKPDAFSDGCMIRRPYTRARTCTVGHGPTRVALVGNSHAAQLLPALQDIAATQDLTITTYLITACSTVDAPLEFPRDSDAEGCEKWRDYTLRHTMGDAYDLVITSQYSTFPVQGYTAETTYQPWVAGMRSFLTSWSDAGTNVLVLRDTPFPRATIPAVPECVTENPVDPAACEGKRSEWLKPDPLVEAARGLPGIRTADLSEYLCTKTMCPGVIGGVVAYFDGSHLTSTFVRTLTPYLEPVVVDALATSRGTVPVAAELEGAGAH